MTELRNRKPPEFKFLPVSKLKQAKKNPRLHGEVSEIVKLVKQFGWANPLLVQRGTYRIVAGHRRRKAAIENKDKLVPCVILDLNDDEALAVNMADNKIIGMSGWSPEKLQLRFKEFVTKGIDLGLTAFPRYEIEPILNAVFTQQPTQPNANKMVTFHANQDEGRAIRKAVGKLKEDNDELSDGEALEIIAKTYLGRME